MERWGINVCSLGSYMVYPTNHKSVVVTIKGSHFPNKKKKDKGKMNQIEFMGAISGSGSVSGDTCTVRWNSNIA